MVGKYEDALICDLAETYHIYDWRQFKISYIATLACGLGANSRIYAKLSGAKVAPDILLLASAVDRLSLLVWAQTKDAQKGKNKPKMIVDQIYKKDQTDSDLKGFDSPEEFEEYIREIRRR